MNTVRPPRKLSNQEQKVLDGRRRGLSYRQIGAELGISIHTAKQYMRRIFEKTDAHSSTEALFKGAFDFEAGTGFAVPITFLPAVKKADCILH